MIANKMNRNTDLLLVSFLFVCSATMAARAGSPGNASTASYEEGFEDMQRRVPDLSKLRALTGYEPKVSLDEILDRVVAYFTSDATRL
jgi:nucleoside-diphosphate-sugar epimerase